jgi:hypothetical protein
MFRNTLKLKLMIFAFAFILTLCTLNFCVGKKSPSVGSDFQGGIVLTFNDTLNQGVIVTKVDLMSNLTWLEGKNLCDTSTYLGYDDWRMPTTKELLLCYQILHIKKIGNFNVKTPYWGSSEGELGYFAWFVDFSDGQAYESNENNIARIRAVRDFRL